jgi:hypothetical protein
MSTIDPVCGWRAGGELDNLAIIMDEHVADDRRGLARLHREEWAFVTRRLARAVGIK